MPLFIHIGSHLVTTALFCTYLLYRAQHITLLVDRSPITHQKVNVMAQFEIVRIPIWPFRMVNAHIVIGSNGAILVDSGLPGSEAKVAKVLKKHGLSFKDIKLIIVTHAHVDHAGNAAVLRELTGAPIVGHEADVQYYRRETPMTFCPTGWAGRMFLKAPLIYEPYQAFEPDILLNNEEAFDLAEYGFPARVTHTPGHTAGSISVEMKTKDALVGDLVASGIFFGGLVRTGRAIRPPFEDDAKAVSIELQRLLDCGIERFYIGHGGPLKSHEVRRHAQALAAMKS